MRIAGFVPKSQNVEVEYIRSVHTVSRWIHEMFEGPDARAEAVTHPGAPKGPRQDS